MRNLAPEATEADVAELCRPFGRVLRVKLTDKYQVQAPKTRTPPMVARPAASAQGLLEVSGRAAPLLPLLGPQAHARPGRFPVPAPAQAPAPQRVRVTSNATRLARPRRALPSLTTSATQLP